ncbi:amino acid deaminase [Microbulbifer celer]|uniref:Amino acid deaminase n=1 Tax=Microbulbifer celer TaxID=435905 RepID=A0ABW3U535_9GAMM|nr:amino acid deaminase [Microbulbifer celer]UFN57638.1 amino acid deaminase [Microbulbifer celer]
MRSPSDSAPLNLLREEIALPAAVIYCTRLQHNLHWMQRFADERGVKLAPHGKTTMVPAFFRHQVAAGAWGMTLATPAQARVAAEAGVSRILMANQLVGKQNCADVSALLRDFPGLDFYCLVDSAQNASQLGAFFSQQEQCLQLLLEFGVSGGRTGCRNADQAIEVCEEIAHWRSLKLCGVETYEGLIHGEDAEARVRTHLQQTRDLCLDLIAQGYIQCEPVILSGAGSAWYDVVSAVFTDHDDQRILPVIRPGCYLTHDRGIYQQAQAAVMARLQNQCCPVGDLQSSLEIWAYVQSRPEPDMAIIAFGKRDAAYDAGLPQPELHFRPGSDQKPTAAPTAWKLTAIMDQHAMMQVPQNADLQVGDIIAFSTSHPCLTFDKWRQLLVVDDDYTVVERVETFF